MCAFATSWGDGLFPILRDLGPEGELVRIRLDLGNENTLDVMRRLNPGHSG